MKKTLNILAVISLFVLIGLCLSIGGFYNLRVKTVIKEVQVEMSEREYGTSYLNAFKSFEYMLRICISILFIQLFRRK